MKRSSRRADKASTCAASLLCNCSMNRAVAVAQWQNEARRSAVMTNPLIAIRMRRADALDFQFAAPVGCRRHRAMVGAQSDRIASAAEFLAAQLADIVLAALRHLGRGGVADMRIVRPHDAFAV